MTPRLFSNRLLDWFAVHGRRDLPWQVRPTPYRVWVSEIMLQQTRVTTVIPYYQRFLSRFPTVKALADARLDEVLHHWSGLGYYARARNLHRAACRIRDHLGGRFPRQFDAVVELPGIGESTAGAILALACGQRPAILDGTVTRVLSRFHAVDGWPGQTRVKRELWTLADRYTPAARASEYTQAIMDLGATLCTRTSPDCGSCPLQSDCAAFAAGRAADYPQSRPRKDLPVRKTRLLLLSNSDKAVWLEQRPPAGIWGGLWSFPDLGQDEDVSGWCRKRFGFPVLDIESWPVVRHTFTHFHLDITPVVARTGDCEAVMEGVEGVWYNTRSPDERGFAAPVQRLLERLQQSAGH